MNHGRRPTGAASPSAWRSRSFSKKTAPASVSLVFAEPEQGTPLESAATKLPPAALYSNDNHMMRKRERLDSTSTVREDRKETQSISGGSMKRYRTSPTGSQPNPSAESLPSQPVQDETVSAPDLLRAGQWEGLTADVPAKATSEVAVDAPVESLDIPFPAPAPAPSSSDLKVPPKPSPKSNSWFGSYGRSKGKEKSAQLASLEEATKDNTKATSGVTNPPPPPPEPVVAAPTPEAVPVPPPVVERQRSNPQEIPSQRQASRGWFSSSPTGPGPNTSPPSQSRPRPSLSPTNPKSKKTHQHSDSVASVTSLDDAVPKLAVLTPANTPQPPSVLHNAADNSLSSLNPSNSRFTLGLPLLGRPKVPLDQVVKAVAVGGDEARKSNGMGSKNEGATETTTSSPPTPTSPLDSSDERQGRSMSKTADGQTRDASPASSWWGYVGWNSPSTNNVADPPTSPTSADLSPGESPTAATIRAVKSTPDLPSATSALIEPTPGAGTKSNKTESINHLAAGANKPPSVFSAQSQGSAWYAPWSWYGNSSSAIAGQGEDKAAGDGDGNGEMTQSERVKEEALARDRVEDTSPPPSAAPTIEVTGASPTPSQEVSNPIENTISSNTSGWASFWSSKSLTTKNITEGGEKVKKDENGMEVMDIDEEEEPDTKAAPPSAASKEPVKALTSQSKPTSTPDSKKPDTSNKEKKEDKDKDGLPKTEKPSNKPTPLPLTNSDSVKRDTAKANARKGSPSPSVKSGGGGTRSPASPRNPNLVLPTWTDTFHAPPRSLVPSPPTSAISKTFNYVSGVLFQKGEKGDTKRKGKGKARDREFMEFGKELPRAYDVIGEKLEPDVLRGCKNAVIIGVHGWFPGAVIRTVTGDPTGTSSKLVDMMLQALDDFQDKHDVRIKKITKIPLEGEGTINKRVDKLYKSLLSNKDWMNDLHTADVVFVATHSQGSIVSTHLIDRLIRDGHLRTVRSIGATSPTEAVASGSTDIVPTVKPQRICCLALCGIHLGPLRYLSTSSILQPYFQYFESSAARELFEFQNTESEVSQAYVKALTNVVHHGTKMVYVASLNDQVVPMYSGLFTTASHPLILRALYVDGDAYQSSDFLSNLLVLILRAMNSGISDSGLLAHLSEATAGSLNGVGHSTAYEDLGTYLLAVDYCFLTNDGLDTHPELVVESFDAKSEQNDYEIPWALRDVIADERVAHFFSNEIVELRDAFRDWHPKTAILRDVKKKLQPIQRLPSSILKRSTTSTSVSKL